MGGKFFSAQCNSTRLSLDLYFKFAPFNKF